MQVFIARQPIFDHQRVVFGYELLFRSGLQNFFLGGNLDQASSHVITTSSMLFDLSTLTNKKKAFINMTEELLLKDTISVLPAAVTGIELSNSTPPSDAVVKTCRRLRASGYHIVLDDYQFTEAWAPLLNLVDIVKVDFLSTDAKIQAEIVSKLAPYKVQLLAKKIETQEDFRRAEKMGYTYFQGYFFAKPEVVSRKDIPAYQLNNVHLLQEISRPDLALDKLEDLLKHDVSLSYKLLRYINSAFFGWSVEIHSVRHALTLLGDKEVRKWATLVALANISVEKPEELMVQAVFRARFIEQLAPHLGLSGRGEDLFLMGLFSLIEAIMDRPAAIVLAEIPIAKEIKDAIQGVPGTFKDVLEVCLNYEQGSWEALSVVSNRLKLPEDKLPELYLSSMEWTRKAYLGTNLGQR